jgi:large subunit ribosomal protein L21
MKKAVIECGGVQHIVAEGDTISVNFLGETGKSVEFAPIMIVDGKDSVVETGKLKASKVTATVEEVELKGDKVIAIRYKAKKRVNTKRGHRQKLTKIKISKITA